MFIHWRKNLEHYNNMPTKETPTSNKRRDRVEYVPQPREKGAGQEKLSYKAEVARLERELEELEIAIYREKRDVEVDKSLVEALAPEEIVEVARERTASVPMEFEPEIVAE